MAASFASQSDGAPSELESELEPSDSELDSSSESSASLWAAVFGAGESGSRETGLLSGPRGLGTGRIGPAPGLNILAGAVGAFVSASESWSLSDRFRSSMSPLDSRLGGCIGNSKWSASLRGVAAMAVSGVSATDFISLRMSFTSGPRFSGVFWLKFNFGGAL